MILCEGFGIVIAFPIFESLTKISFSIIKSNFEREKKNKRLEILTHYLYI